MTTTSKQILIIEDDPLQRSLTKDLLTFQNYTVIEAEDGETALAILKKHKPHLVLMDINLPDIDGITIIKEIRSMLKFANTPIIVLTAHSQTENKQIILAAGATAYLTKPVDIQHLFKKIHKAI